MPLYTGLISPQLEHSLSPIYSELQHAMTEDAVVKKFDPDGIVQSTCQVTTFQDHYFITNSFREAKEKIKEFIKTIETPFQVNT